MQTTTVSHEAIEARVRRALRREGEVLRKTRPGRTWAKNNYGDYYTVNVWTGYPTRGHLNLEQLARDCDVLRPGEVIEE